MKKYILEITVFCSGAVVMILELAGSRILAPHAGTSILVWTSLIGIILGSLSLGYFLGGKLADKKATFRTLGVILFSAAVLITITSLIKTPVLTAIETSMDDLRAISVFSTIILFTPASVALGMVSPYCIKLKLHELKATGRTVGNLYAISTIGSIVGTFLSGFFLITYFGNTNLLFLLSGILVAISILVSTSLKFRATAAAIMVLGVIGVFIQTSQDVEAVEINTTYSYIKIYDDLIDNKPVKVLKINNNFHSAMSLTDNELIFEYTKFYRLVDHFSPNVENALMIGGGAYSYPKDFLANHENSNLDVVEIDAELTELAKEHFKLEDDPRLTIYHEDGRTYLNKNEKIYDAIFQDAFSSSLAVPYHLTTVEHITNLYNSLSDDGVVISNIISSFEGEEGQFLRAQYKTYKEVFPYVHLFPVNYPEYGSYPQNVMFIATKNKKTLESSDPELNSYLDNLWKKEIPDDMPILTDDFAPVDQYTLKMFQ